MLKKRNPVLRKLAILAMMLAGAVPALAQGAAGEPHPDTPLTRSYRSMRPGQSPISPFLGHPLGPGPFPPVAWP